MRPGFEANLDTSAAPTQFKQLDLERLRANGFSFAVRVASPTTSPPCSTLAVYHQLSYAQAPVGNRSVRTDAAPNAVRLLTDMPARFTPGRGASVAWCIEDARLMLQG